MGIKGQNYREWKKINRMIPLQNTVDLLENMPERPLFLFFPSRASMPYPPN
jgi:hypothetical protein